jgi:hypothetical protein
MGRDPSRWTLDVPHYGRVRFCEVYPGIDLAYHSEGGELEFDFLADAYSSPEHIALDLSMPVRLNESGGLEFGTFVLRAPKAWQTEGGRRKPVEIRFDQVSARRVRFRLGPYDRAFPLTIDPVVEFSAALGGSEEEIGTLIAAGPSGEIYVTGSTRSADFPADLPPDSLLNRPAVLLASDVYVARLSADGRTLEWSVFLGGNGTDTPSGIALDALGNVYVLGMTKSANFPVTEGAYRTRIHPAMGDLFVVRLDAATGRVKAGTYLGAANAQFGGMNFRLAVDAAGGVYVGGQVWDDEFPTTPGAYQAAGVKLESLATGSGHGFLMRLNPALSARVYATFFDYGSIAAIAVDAGGNLVFGGAANCQRCPTGGFPAVNPVPGVDQSFAVPAAYVAKLNAAGTATIFASKIGGSSVSDLKLAPDGRIHLTGSATAANLVEVRPLALDPVPAEFQRRDAAVFLAHMPAAGGSISQATLFYGPQYGAPAYLPWEPPPQRLVLLPDGRPCISSVGSREFVQTAGGLAGSSRNGVTSFVCVNADITALALKTALPEGILSEFAVSPDGAILAAGHAYTINANTDAVVARFALRNPAPAIHAVLPSALTLDTNITEARTVRISGAGFAFGAEVTWNGTPVKNVFINEGRIEIQGLKREAIHTGPNRIEISLPGPGGGSASAEVIGLSPAPGLPATSPLFVLAGAGETKLVVRANNIVPDSVLLWDGSPRTAQYAPDFNATGHLELVLPAAELTQPRIVRIAIENPGPGGGRSRETVFSILSSGTALTLAIPPAVLFGGEPAAAPIVALSGSGFDATVKAFWDGIEVPCEISSPTRLTMRPPGADLERWGMHQAYLVRGTARTATVDVIVARSVGNLAASDVSRDRLYAVGGTGLKRFVYVLDLKTGALLERLDILGENTGALALSDGGQYLYFAGVFNDQKIRRYNLERGVLDLEWTGGVRSGNQFDRALLPLPGLPESVAVATATGDVLIYDNGRARRRGAIAAGLPSGLDPVFATASRIYFGSSTPGCWVWADYDASGLKAGPLPCAVASPPEAVNDSGVIYFEHAGRNWVASAPGWESYSSNGSRALIDPVRRRLFTSFVEGLGTVIEMNLDTGEQRTRILMPERYRVYPGSGGAFIVSGPGWITALE